MVCTTCLGPRLGEFDFGRVRDLGLPTIAGTPGSISEAAVAVAPEPGKVILALTEIPAAKFQLGETLPVVPARLV